MSLCITNSCIALPIHIFSLVLHLEVVQIKADEVTQSHLQRWLPTSENIFVAFLSLCGKKPLLVGNDTDGNNRSIMEGRVVNGGQGYIVL